jgi:two-component system phosphate regulon sensor histidine kinase PhoR
MNRSESSGEPSSERERDLQRASEFHAVLLAMAGHDLRQPLQVIQHTYQWLGGRLEGDAERVRLRQGELAVARLTEQLDRLAGALRLYEHTTTMELAQFTWRPY